MYLGPALIKTTHRSRENVTETIEATGKPVDIISFRLPHDACVTLVDLLYTFATLNLYFLLLVSIM